MSEPQANAKSIFLNAVEIPSAAARLAYLAEACGADTTLRREVEALLAHQAGLGSFLEAAGPVPVATADEPMSERPGTVIGPYKLLEQIGEGGFGVVFLAEQTQPVRRKVALKIVKPGMDTRQVVARFEAERQALALMDHPNIAQVFDGGATATGRPFFSMELVKGVPITAFCDQHQLPPRQRLELFLPVCQAVQHAHQKGIIHRDLKPSNILVTVHDVTPVVKVIDFGVAKALGQELTDKSLFTGLTQMIGTPLYMSPEQAGQSGLDIDTRSDIYALGVLLYELLTGTTPFDGERLQTVGFDELRRIIREEEPPRPSARLSTLGQAATTLSTQRQSDPWRLSQLYRGELDWIVMKALEKDRNRRYESASAFAADVQRYLHDEPVQACPPSALYQLGKFARRNKMSLAVASALGLAVLLAVIVLAIDNAVITRQKQEKEEALEQKEKALLQVRQEKERADWNLEKAEEAVGHYLYRTAEDGRLKSSDLHDLRKDLLANAVAYYEEFVKQKGDDAKLQAKRGAAYYVLAYLRAEMGERKQAMADYERAQAIFARLTGDLPARPRDRQLLGYCHNELGSLFRELGKPAEAEEAYGKALSLQQQLVGEFATNPNYRLELAGTHSNLGVLFRQRGDPAQAEAHHTRGLALRKQLADEFPKLPQCRRDLARSHINLGFLRNAQGKADEAEAHYRQALDLQAELAKEFPGVPDYRHDLGGTHLNLSELLPRLGKPAAEGEGHCRQAIDLLKKLTEDFPGVPKYRHTLALSQGNLGHALRALDKPAEAEAAFRQALANMQKLSDDSPGVPGYRSELAGGYSDLGLLLRAQRRGADAEESFRKALALQEKLTAESPAPHYESRLGGTLNNLAMLLMDRGDLAEAGRLLRQAVNHQKAALTSFPQHPTYRRFLRNHYGHLAETLVRLGEHAEAARVAEELDQVFPQNPADSYDAGCYLARCVPLAEKDPQRNAEDRHELAQAYAGRAVMLVRRAIQNGWNDAVRTRTDPHLDPLRSRDDFKELMAQLESKANK